MKKIMLPVFVFVFAVLFKSNVFAETKTKTLVNLPTFKASEIELVDKPIAGDLMIAGKQVKITSDINGDVYVAGGKVEVDSKIGGNLIVVGGEVKILGKVLKNLIMAGGKVEVDENAEIGGYTLAGGQEINLLGKFMGPVKLGAETLLVGQKTIINGNLEADVTKSEVAETSKIVGEKNIKIHEVKKPEVNESRIRQMKQVGYAGKLISFLSKLLVLLIFVKLFGKRINQIDLKNYFWANIGLGLAVLVVTPFLVIISMITIVAIPLSMIILVLYFLTIYLSSIVVSMVLGNYIFVKNKFKENFYLQAIVGLLLISLLEIVPIVGGFTRLVVLLLGMGIVFKSLKMFSKKTA